jgi:hypothetical protein
MHRGSATPRITNSFAFLPPECLTVVPSSRDDEDAPTVLEGFLDSLFVGRPSYGAEPWLMMYCLCRDGKM